MLKNDYLELYLQKSRILSEFEKEIQQDQTGSSDEDKEPRKFEDLFDDKGNIK